MAETGPSAPEEAVDSAEASPTTVTVEDRNGEFIRETKSNERDKVGARLELSQARLSEAETTAAATPEELDQISEAETTAAATPEELDQMRQLVRDDRKEYSQLTLELWRKGGIDKLEPNDLTLLLEDLRDGAERSALAELVLSRHGYKTAEEALRKLKLSEVTVDDLAVALPEEGALRAFWKSPATQEQLKKIGLSGGVSVSVTAAIALLGGPVSWATIGFGLAGGAIGRGVGELIRGGMLNKQVEKAGTDETEAFKEKAGRDLFELIVSLQARGREIEADQEAAENPNLRAQRILELVEQANQAESRSKQDVAKLEKRAGWIKSGLAVLGAVGGSLIGNAMLHGATEAKIQAAQADKATAMKDAAEHGVRIHHVDGHAELTLDPKQGHLVKKTVDGAWRYAIENKDIGDWHTAIHDKGEWVKEFYHSYLASAPHGVGRAVPDVLPAQELLHAGTISDVSITSAINAKYEAIMSTIHGRELWAKYVADGLVVGSTVMAEYLGARKEKMDRAEIERDDRTLIDSINEVEEMLRAKIILPADGKAPNGWEFPDDPKRFEQFFKDLADFYHVPLPKNPREYAYDWNTQPAILDKQTIDGKVDFWYQVKRGEEIDANGMPVEAMMVPEGDHEIVQYGVLGVSPEKNRIAIVGKEINPATNEVVYPVKVVRLDQFLATYRLNGPLRRAA